ncbi:MAG: glycosyltransferase family 2 protein [Flavobacteriales bacterium]
MISIIIVSYNTCDILRDCLTSVYQTEIEAEVVVIDNNSNDGSAEMVARDFPHVKLIRNNNNPGFSAANNQGIEVTTGEYILLLNPDTILKKDSLKNLIQCAARHPMVILGPALFNKDESLQVSAWKFPVVLNAFLELFYLHKLVGVSDYPVSSFSKEFECDFVSGAAMFFERNMLKELKGLDETLFWMEDVDFCYRAKKNGWKTVYCPASKIIHLGGQSSVKNYKKAIANQLLSRLKFFKKNHSFFAFILAALVSFFHILSRIIAFSLLFVFNQTPKARAYWYTMKRFFQYIFAGNTTVA